MQEGANKEKDVWVGVEQLEGLYTIIKATTVLDKSWDIREYQLDTTCHYDSPGPQRIFSKHNDAAQYIHDKSFTLPTITDIVVILNNVLDSDPGRLLPLFLPRLAFNLYTVRADISIEQGQRLHTFTCFQRLPVELRLQIWEHTLPPSRLVKLKQTTPSENCEWEPHCNLLSPSGSGQFRVDYVGGNIKVVRRWETTTKGPVALQICQESREIALQSYFPLFHGSPDTSPLYFSPTNDLFSIETTTAVKTLEILQNMAYFGVHGQLAGITSVCLSANFWNYAFGRLPNYLNYSDKELLGILKSLHGLREMVVTVPSAARHRSRGQPGQREHRDNRVMMLLHELRKPSHTPNEVYELETMLWLANYRHNFWILRRRHGLTDFSDESIKVLRDGVIYGSQAGYEKAAECWKGKYGR